MKKISLIMLSAALVYSNAVFGHCQMPCGIYHDDMVYDEIDQFVETMYKGISVINDSRFANTKERNEFIRWIIQKEKMSDAVADMITQYFLQQKIKPGEPDTAKRLDSAHRLLFNLVAIKQNTTLEFVEDFSKEWDKFKLMFHRKGYECALEKMKLAEQEAKMKEADRQNEGQTLHEKQSSTMLNSGQGPAQERQH